ncbi:calsequestrin-1-like [Stegodyphus dumicola]|uniref:calsequestrin-1-like n=1 Tax=Stegodyphus dumicola TaxID=202533 RepID=UPI0015B352B2|nr:calsequestrin-1-like [Stegodyphus dumicola]
MRTLSFGILTIVCVLASAAVNRAFIIKEENPHSQESSLLEVKHLDTETDKWLNNYLSDSQSNEISSKFEEHKKRLRAIRSIFDDFDDFDDDTDSHYDRDYDTDDDDDEDYNEDEDVDDDY